MNTQENSPQTNPANDQPTNSTPTGKAKVTHNLDTGKDEPLPDLEDESIMDFGSGSGGGAAGDGGAS